jgi:hypothetical protein
MLSRAWGHPADLFSFLIYELRLMSLRGGGLWIAGAQSRAAWVAKLSIVIEEVDESCFWMEFILDEDLLPRKRMAPLLGEGEELRSMFIAARDTTQTGCKS